MQRTRLAQRVVALGVAAGAAFASSLGAADKPSTSRGLADWTQAIVKAIGNAGDVGTSATSTESVVAPTPVKVLWQAKRLTSIVLGGPLLTMVLADVQGDGQVNLYVVTDRDLIAYSLDPTVHERARIALPKDEPTQRSRAPVATIVVEPPVAESASVHATSGAIVVRSSSRGRGARYEWHGGQLQEAAPVPGFPMCDGRTLELVPGRNYFGPVEAPLVSVACNRGLVSAKGTPLVATATLGIDGKLALHVAPFLAASTAGQDPSAGFDQEFPGVGAAVAIGDIDHDGWVDVISSSAAAPGDSDTVSITTTGGRVANKRVLFHRGFSGGVVAVAVGDIDGDHEDEVLCATRLPGADRVDLWQLNR